MTNGVYIKMTPQNVSFLEDFSNKHLSKFKVTTDFHCTLIFSRKSPSKPILTNPSFMVSTKIIGFDCFQHKDQYAIVALLEPTELIKRHNHFMKTYNLSFDFPSYIPHITLALSDSKVDTSFLSVSNEPILLSNEIAEKLIS